MLVAKRTSDFFPTLFNDLFENFNYGMPKTSSPQMNIIENQEEFKIEMSVPGLTKEDLTLNIDSDNNLVIEMVKKSGSEENNKKQQYLRREFTTAHFKEMLALPDIVKTEEIRAKVENGILEVTLPKIKPEEKIKLTKTIEIA
ncbi:MAG: Hsp20/alpha crystallin family protein [Bacteroidales bacterium]|nr:Hsp20/alpha crystallin family protein [Bacteroidales bacterium]